MDVSIKGARSESEGIGAVITLSPTTVNDKPSIKGNVVFTGAAIYYAYYAEVAVDKMETEKKATKEDGRRRGRIGGAKPEKVNMRDLRKLVNIFPASQWPKKVDKYAVDELEL